MVLLEGADVSEGEAEDLRIHCEISWEENKETVKGCKTYLKHCG
jgi:hypothetical protein